VIDDPRPPILIIGYGNELRGDDGLGRAVAHAVRSARRPGVRVRELFQLTPELAAELAEVRLAIFVDAAMAQDPPVRIARLDAPESESMDSHVTDPAALLAMARAVFGRAPSAWLVTVAGTDFSMSERLSPTAACNLEIAVAAVQALVEREMVSVACTSSA
jgi:hydrogenase maturation protease